MEYHVLSNSDVFNILNLTVVLALIVSIKFAKWASRDASPEYKKGSLAKFVPWILLLIFISESSLIMYMLSVYSWDITPEPSAASIHREIRYLGHGTPIWGWANDTQSEIVDHYGLWTFMLCWTVYAFRYKRSDISWWKKTCKVIAYILISILIIGFTHHELKDFLGYSMYLIPAFILLKLSRKKKQKNSDSESKESAYEEVCITPVAIENSKMETEDSSRYMPKLATEENQDSNSSLKQEIEISPNPQLSSGDTAQGSDTMFCKHCGQKIEADSSFCKYCGKSLK